MSVLVKNMDMPKCCGRCPWWDVEYGRTVCRLKEDTIDVWVDEDVSRPDWCPLVEVKTHGRLIDADVLKETIVSNVYPVSDCFNSRDYGMFWTGGIEKAIDETPTVIEGG